MYVPRRGGFTFYSTTKCHKEMNDQDVDVCLFYFNNYSIRRTCESNIGYAQLMYWKCTVKNVVAFFRAKRTVSRFDLKQ